MRRLALLILLAACTSAPKTSGTAELARDRLFPYGTYRHKVDLIVKLDSDKTKKIALEGVVDLREGKTQVVGLSAFGTTEFKIVEDRKDGKVTVEIFREALKKSEQRFRDYYSVLRRLLDAKMSLEQGSEHVDADTGSRFKLADYDRNRIPMSMEVHHRAFTALIKVAAYEL